MKKFSLSILIILVSCSSNKIRYVNDYNCPLDYIEPKFEFELVLKEFYQNNAYAFTEGTPYGLLIGVTNDPRLPKKITVFSRYDNNKYSIGSRLKIIPNETKTHLKPIFMVKDTVVGNTKFRKIIGCENKIVWGNPKD